ncbi:uncharacterized protein LOC131663313 [Phymastichus coffea]|uniref:uncharacterized protein LOC131663313 n=1 Tax=Phymastichus coffea TaxID=108790 RepID=UPI00273B1B39|nr:uncharacterized protein LOC131663313 [Phymastichus coffea]
MILLPPQMYREFHLSIVIAKKMRMNMKTRVPRNLFGSPESKDSVQLLQDTLDQERAHFQRRWSIDPLAEDDDKENGPQGCNAKGMLNKRCSPYTKQRSMHDYWRSRKAYELGKSSTAAACPDAPRPAPEQSPPRMQSSLSLPPTRAQLPLQGQALEPRAPSSTHEAQQPPALLLLDMQQADKQLDNVQPSAN